MTKENAATIQKRQAESHMQEHSKTRKCKIAIYTVHLPFQILV